jgi:hypothetical protein
LVRPQAGVRPRNRGEEFGRLTYATKETFVLTPLLCWAHLSPEQYRERVAALIAEIEAGARAIRREKGFRSWATRPFERLC